MVYKQLFVVNTKTLGATISDAKGGQLTFVKNNGTAAATLTAGDVGVQFMIRNQTSNGLNTGDLKRASNQAYAAGTKQKSTVDITAAAPTGQVKFVKLIDTSFGSSPRNQRTFEGTAAEITAAINADDMFFKDYAASAASEKITIEAPYDSTFRISTTSTGIVAYTGVGTAQMSPTSGTPEEVLKLERELLAYEGIKSVAGFPVVAPPSQVDLAGTYDLVYADFQPKKENKAVSGGAVVYETYGIIFACKIIAGEPAGSVAASLLTEILKLA